jgi:hypothetical protein
MGSRTVANCRKKVTVESPGFESESRFRFSRIFYRNFIRNGPKSGPQIQINMPYQNEKYKICPKTAIFSPWFASNIAVKLIVKYRSDYMFCSDYCLWRICIQTMSKFPDPLEMIPYPLPLFRILWSDKLHIVFFLWYQKHYFCSQNRKVLPTATKCSAILCKN